MEKRKSSLSAIKACRFCLAQDGSLSSLYDRTMTPKNSVTLPLQIMSCVSVEVFPSDRMPSQICERCRYFMDLCYRFKQICRQADETIMDYVLNGEALEPVVWHNKLTKVFRSANQPQAKRQEKKLPGKANSTEEYETDEDNENVYNIKIGDGPDDGNKESTCIKVVRTGDRLHITKDDPKGKKEFLSRSRNPASPTERPFQCPYCKKTFVKSHHCTRHVRVKHKENVLMSPNGPFGGVNPFNCEQCDETFLTQDELIYHSAKHAAENLICPLCHEKFNQVEEVSAHIKTHVDGAEYMCDLCELVFTTKEKLDKHLIEKHEDELKQEDEMGLDDESMDMEDEEDDDNINVKDAGDHMVVEIKKPSEFIKSPEPHLKVERDENTNSEESEMEATYTELATVDTIALAKEAAAPPKPVPKIVAAPKRQERPTEKPEPIHRTAAAGALTILRKADDVKRKSQKPIEITSSVMKAKFEPTSTSTAGASDKSLRLLEKELQELQRTNNHSEATKTPKNVEMRGRRPLLHTSTPKPKVEEKKPVSKPSPAMEKKQPERRVITKENKEPKEKEPKEREPKANNNKEDKDKESREQKEVQAKSIVKNGAGGDRQSSEDNVRRSSRPSKVKDYAKMIRDKAGSDDDSDDSDDEEYVEEPPEKVLEKEKSNRGRKPKPKTVPQSPATAPDTQSTAPRKRGRPRKGTPKDVEPEAQLTPAPPSSAPPSPEPEIPSVAPRKRGRPRRDASEDMPAKVKKTNEEEDESDEEKPPKQEKEVKSIKEIPADVDEEKKPESSKDASPTKAPEKDNLMVSPTGQTLKKVPIKALPPGIKPMPLPMNAVRNVGSGLCEMQIGKKVVKVQKIVMTKAEVEAMKNQGLVEMKDGTMVLKQGIKLPKCDSASFKSSLVGNEATKESPTKKDKATPTRCTFDDDS